MAKASFDKITVTTIQVSPLDGNKIANCPWQSLRERNSSYAKLCGLA